MPRIEVNGDICLRRPRPTQGCRANDHDNGPEKPTHAGILTLNLLAPTTVSARINP